MHESIDETDCLTAKGKLIRDYSGDWGVRKSPITIAKVFRSRFLL